MKKRMGEVWARTYPQKQDHQTSTLKHRNTNPPPTSLKYGQDLITWSGAPERGCNRPADPLEDCTVSSDVQCCRDIYWTRPGPKLLCSLCQHQQNHNAFGLPVRTTGCTSIWSAATVSSYLLTWMTRGWCERIILTVSLSCKQGGKCTQVNLYLQKST